MTKKLLVKYKSGRKHIYENVSYFEYIPKYDIWAIGSIKFKSHEKTIPNKNIIEIGFIGDNNENTKNK